MLVSSAVMILADAVIWLSFLLTCCLPAIFVCCCEPCEILTDTFATDTIANYDQRSGSWSVSGGFLTTTSASALIVSNTAVPSTLSKVHVFAVLKMASSSDKGRVVFAYVDDNNYWFVEVQPGAVDGSMSLYKRASGTNTLQGSVGITSFTASNYSKVRVCYDGETVTATGRNTTANGAIDSTNCFTITKTASVTISSTKCGLGTGSGSSDVKCDRFYFNRHPLDKTGCDGCADCPSGTTLCTLCDNGGAARKQMLLNLYDWDDAGTWPAEIDCPNMNGWYVLDWVAEIDGECFWSYSFPSAVTCNGDSIAALIMRVYMDSQFNRQVEVHASTSTSWLDSVHILFTFGANPADLECLSEENLVPLLNSDSSFTTEPELGDVYPLA